MYQTVALDIMNVRVRMGDDGRFFQRLFVQAPRDIPKLATLVMALWSLPEADTDGKQNALLLRCI